MGLEAVMYPPPGAKWICPPSGTSGLMGAPVAETAAATALAASEADSSVVATRCEE
jgi:hypothetical protein